jgi:hypothetical protein
MLLLQLIIRMKAGWRYLVDMMMIVLWAILVMMLKTEEKMTNAKTEKGKRKTEEKMKGKTAKEKGEAERTEK